MQKVIIGIAPQITVEIASDNIKEIIEQASFWSSLPSNCPICQAPVVFFHRLTKDDDSYWGQTCTGQTTHEANFGVYKKEARGFYYKGQWEKAYGSQQGDDFSGQQSQPNDYASAQRSAPAPGQQTADPQAKSMGDMVTAKQLGMIRAIAREIQMNPEDECYRMFKCGTDELSKRAASDMIEHLQSVQKVGFKVTAAPSPLTGRAEPHPNGGLPDDATGEPLPTETRQDPAPAPAGYSPHPPSCQCADCDIPF